MNNGAPEIKWRKNWVMNDLKSDTKVHGPLTMIHGLRSSNIVQVSRF
jgi:hypothetical protein